MIELNKEVMDTQFYLSNFSEPSFTSWKIKEDLATSPINHQINIREIDYKTSSRKSQSEIMWFYSIGWIAKLDAIQQENKLTISLLSDFLNFISSTDAELVYLKKNNSNNDYCVALRIRYVCMMIARNQDDKEVINILTEILIKDIKWFVLLNNIAINNYGMMMCVSILHAYLFLKNDITKIAITKAKAMLENILNEKIPENGYVTENTVGYHDFYYKALKSLNTFTSNYNDFKILNSFIKQKFMQTEQALYKVVMPNGNIPQIGQSGFYPTKYKSIQGNHCFAEQGFFVKKDDQNYLSYTCGYKTIVHKQLDNTSLTLNLNGEQIFLDCGIGTYDSKDVRANVMNGQRGHSGAFYQKFDSVKRNEFLKSQDIKNIRSLLVEKNNLIMSYFSFDFEKYNYYISRVIEINDFYNLKIVDTFKTDDMYAFPVSRFILPSYVNIIVDSNILTIEYQKYIVKFTINNNFNYSLKSASNDFTDELFAHCWQAKKFNQYEECKMLEFYPTAANTLQFLISIKDKI